MHGYGWVWLVSFGIGWYRLLLPIYTMLSLYISALYHLHDHLLASVNIAVSLVIAGYLKYFFR